MDEPTSNPFTGSPTRLRRPFPVTVICSAYIWFVLFEAFTVWQEMSEQGKAVGWVVPAFLVAVIISVTGMWRMKKWAGICFVILSGGVAILLILRGMYNWELAVAAGSGLVIATQLYLMR